jgi:hypothetical protein
MKTIVVKMKDKTGASKVNSEIDVEFMKNRITIRELIEARVYAEVERYNNKLPEYFQGLVQPTNAEKTINGYKMKEKKKIDPEKQVYIALDAFQKNAYFLLIDRYQPDSLDKEITITPQTEVTFLKLTPLVGG